MHMECVIVCCSNSEVTYRNLRDGQGLNLAHESTARLINPVCRYIDKASGRRSDIPHYYIYNYNHGNLTILDRKRVVRVVLEYVSLSCL